MEMPLHSNLAVYRAIAEESNEEAQKLWASARRLMPDGAPGIVITYDPSQRSFKQSLIAITFAAFYLEALLFVVGRAKLGARWNDAQDKKSYEDKLRALGIDDEPLLSDAKRLRLCRRDLAHEKAMPVGEAPPGEIRWAHEEAAHAVQFIERIAKRLRPPS